MLVRQVERRNFLKIFMVGMAFLTLGRLAQLSSFKIYKLRKKPIEYGYGSGAYGADEYSVCID